MDKMPKALTEIQSGGNPDKKIGFRKQGSRSSFYRFVRYAIPKELDIVTAIEAGKAKLINEVDVHTDAIISRTFSGGAKVFSPVALDNVRLNQIGVSAYTKITKKQFDNFIKKINTMTDVLYLGNPAIYTLPKLPLADSKLELLYTCCVAYCDSEFYQNKVADYIDNMAYDYDAARCADNAKKLFEAKEYERAIKKFHSTTWFSPDWWQFYMWSAAAFINMGNIKDALAEYSAILPDRETGHRGLNIPSFLFAEVYCARGSAYLLLGDYDKAREDFLSAQSYQRGGNKHE